MAKQQFYKCPYCKEQVSAEESIKKGRRYYHSDCLEKRNQQKTQKEIDGEEYKDLIKYICEDLYQIKTPTGQILSQIKQFKNEYGYRYKGMELALRYHYEILGNRIRENDGVGIIPYVYEKAKQQYIKKQNIAEIAKDESKHKQPKRTVYIDTNKQKRNKLIDISQI